MLIVGWSRDDPRGGREKKRVSKEWNEEVGGKRCPKNTTWNDKTRQEIPGIKHEPEKMSVYGSYAAIIIK